MKYFSDEVLRKADDLKAGVESAFEEDGVWSVESSRGVGSYRVESDLMRNEETGRWQFTYLTCTCRHGQVANGRAKCSHAAAALMVAKENILEAEKARVGDPDDEAPGEEVQGDQPA